MTGTEFKVSKLYPAESSGAAKSRIDKQVSSTLEKIAGTANMTLIVGILLPAAHAKTGLS
jgi:hypothetical protein